MKPYSYDNKYQKKGFVLVAGIDEAGRGSLAGPVTAAVVIFPKYIDIDGIKDSKQLSPKKREILSTKIKEKALAFSIISIDNTIIDKINILQATLLAMKKAILSLKIKPSICLIDGNQKIQNLQIRQETVIGGDNKSLSIAAASILAKVRRDALMSRYSKLYPNYEFEKHSGYCTEVHIEAIKKFGICPIHRTTFKPVSFIK